MINGNSNQLIAQTHKLAIEGVGKKVEEFVNKHVTSVSVVEEVNESTMFTIKLSMATKPGKMEDYLDTLKPGTKITVKMGESFEEIMTGAISAMDFSISKECQTLEVRGFDDLYGLRFGEETKSFNEKTIKSIMNDLLSPLGTKLNLTPDSLAKYTHDAIHQFNQSNWEFLKGLLKSIDHELIVRKGKIYLRPAGDSNASEATLAYDEGLCSFNVKVKELTEGSEVRVEFWSVKEQKMKVAIANEGKVRVVGESEDNKTGHDANVSGKKRNSVISIRRDDIVSVNQAREIAARIYKEKLREFVTGQGVAQGNPAIRAGSSVKIDGLTNRVNGKYYVTRASHISEKSGYKTNFSVRRSLI